MGKVGDGLVCPTWVGQTPEHMVLDGHSPAGVKDSKDCQCMREGAMGTTAAHHGLYMVESRVAYSKESRSVEVMMVTARSMR
jgi:hypothetical protein